MSKWLIIAEPQRRPVLTLLQQICARAGERNVPFTGQVTENDLVMKTERFKSFSDVLDFGERVVNDGMLWHKLSDWGERRKRLRTLLNQCRVS